VLELAAVDVEGAGGVALGVLLVAHFRIADRA